VGSNVRVFVLDKRLVSFFRQTTGLLLHQQSLHSFCEQEVADGTILSRPDGADWRRFIRHALRAE